MIDTKAEELLSRLLDGDIESISNEDETTLRDNREDVIARLNMMFSEEVPRLLEGKECLNPIALFWGLKLAGFLEASEAFGWLKKLCHVPMDILDQELGMDFIIEEMPYLLADIIDEWDGLKLEIEDFSLDEFIRSACLDALVYSSVKGRLERSELIEYFKSLFQRILSGELDDEAIATDLVSTCSDFWPGECLEEIREAFGLDLVDETHLGLDDVLRDFTKGKETCIKSLKEQIKRHSFSEEESESSESYDDSQSRNLDRLLQLMDYAEIEAEQAFKTPSIKGFQRNATCHCGSGLKYKKCCMNKPPLPDLPSTVMIEESVISYEPLHNSDALNALPEIEREAILSLYYLLEEKPEEVAATSLMYIAKYPDIPMLYNYLYGAYRRLNHPYKAIKLLKETVQMFPDYLFGRVEYALYLLRRGEPEKAYEALGNAGTLSQLYPDRKVFHASEWKSFAYAMALYWIQKKDLKQAKVYQGIIQEIFPTSAQTKDLEQKIRTKIFVDSVNRQTEELVEEESS